MSYVEEGLCVYLFVVVWVEFVSKFGFEVCVCEVGIGINGSGIINWLVL